MAAPAVCVWVSVLVCWRVGVCALGEMRGRGSSGLEAVWWRCVGYCCRDYTAAAVRDSGSHLDGDKESWINDKPNQGINAT